MLLRGYHSSHLSYASEQQARVHPAKLNLFAISTMLSFQNRVTMVSTQQIIRLMDSKFSLVWFISQVCRDNGYIVCMRIDKLIKVQFHFCLHRNMFKPTHHPTHSTTPAPQKFLAKHPPTRGTPFFNCCRHVCINDSQANQITERTDQPKVSIKQLKRRRGQSFLQEESQSRSKSKHTKTSQKTSIQHLKRRHNPQLPPSPPTHSPSTLTHLSQQPNKPISTPNRSHKDLAVHNFHTTNYVVGQCLVQPQQANFIFEENPQINATIQDELNSIFDNNQSQDGQHLPIQTNHKKKKIDENALKQELRSYANFSFGQRQKQEIFSKYLNKITNNLKQSSNCLSEKSRKQQKMLFQMYEIDSTIQQQLNKLNEQDKNRFLRDTFQKKSLNYLVNKVGRTVFRSESQHTESKESMVIDTHKSIIEKYQNCKEIHLVS